jgi:hypothetical protein
LEQFPTQDLFQYAPNEYEGRGETIVLGEQQIGEYE